MIYALDTNIISYILRGNEDVKKRWRRGELNGRQSVILLIVYLEIKRGLLAAGAKNKLAAFELMTAELGVDVLTVEDVDLAASLYSECKGQGRLMDDADLLIAAQAISRGCTLVTNNTKHFEGLKGLLLTNWV
ncbi:MAG: PIN domain-containing protein [Synergistaceae bacterium]|jgi:predicted nucleic acid-binding protein|nr:PIN domain-containing protein [Synergistaceae bacterium]